MLFPHWGYSIFGFSPNFTHFHPFSRFICICKGYLDHVFVQDTTISLNCAMPVIPSQVAFEFAIKFSSGRSHQLTRVMWLVKRNTRQRASSSTPNKLVAEIASAGLSPQWSLYYVDKGFNAHTKGGTPSMLEGVEGGN